MAVAKRRSLARLPTRSRRDVLSDPRLAANYEKHGIGTAAFVRDALAVLVERSHA